MTAELDMNRIPRHIAIIMDGNGRWAASQGKPRTYGHQAGVDTVRRITAECVRLGVKYLTLYTFSTENWNRPADEISALMGLVLTSLEDEIFMKHHVKFQVIGDTKRLPQEVQDKLWETMEHTAQNEAMTMVVALSYSSRWEIIKAMQETVWDACTGGSISDPIKVEELENQLADRRIRLEKAGNIAEAALQLNRIFEAAQKAADDYVLGVTGKPVTEAAGKAEDSVKSKGKDPEDSGRMEESDHKKAEDPSREPAKEAEDEKKPAYSERALQEESRQQDPEEEDWDIQVTETELEEPLPDSAEETQEKASMEIEYEDLRAKDS